MKKVSVIIPVYNRELYIGSALESVIAQTYHNIEIIVINDGSTDNTFCILRKFKERFDNLIVIDQKNQGQVIARNVGITESTGDYIAFLDSDDTWESTKLEKQMPLFKEGVGLVYSGITEVDENFKKIRIVPVDGLIKGDAYRYLLVKNRMTGGTVVVSREAIEKVGLFDTNLKAAENWDLWIRISKYFKIDYVNEPLVNYRIHSENISGNCFLMVDAVKSILNKHLPEMPTVNDFKDVYREAYANYYYLMGLNCFNNYDLANARYFFKQSNYFYPGYRDIRMRILRTYFGKNINKFISIAKKTFRMI